MAHIDQFRLGAIIRYYVSKLMNVYRVNLWSEENSLIRTKAYHGRSPIFTGEIIPVSDMLNRNQHTGLPQNRYLGVAFQMWV